jgi:hypothetical protein
MVSHLSRPRSRPVSLTWQAARTSGHPRILLTSPEFRPARVDSRSADLAPTTCGGTCARLCHESGGELDQIKFLLVTPLSKLRNEISAASRNCDRRSTTRWKRDHPTRGWRPSNVVVGSGRYLRVRSAPTLANARTRASGTLRPIV